MSALSIRLPNSIHEAVRRLAEVEGVSINQFVASAVGEKLAILIGDDYLRERASSVSRADFERALRQIPDRAPDPNDTIDEYPPGVAEDIAKYVGDVIPALRELHDSTGELFDMIGTIPIPGSIGFAERGELSHPDMLLDAQSQGSLLLEAAADHLLGLQKLVSNPVQPVGASAPTRAVIESSALAYWLFDPTIDPNVRVGRSLAFRYDGMVQESRFASSISREASVKEIKSRMDRVARKAEDLGYESPRKSSGKRTLTEIVRNTGMDESAYRLLSAVAHNHSWAVRQIAFTVDPANLPGPSGASTVPLEKVVRPEWIAYLCQRAGAAFIRATYAKWRLFTPEAEHFRRVVGPIAKTLRVGDPWI